MSSGQSVTAVLRISDGVQIGGVVHTIDATTTTLDVELASLTPAIDLSRVASIYLAFSFSVNAGLVVELIAID